MLGNGLVRTVDSFGTTGESPTHPDLLDHLAVQFIPQGWSIKRLIRSIVGTTPYRLSSASTNDHQDPENQLLSHANRIRLDAESLRDTMLFLGDELEYEMGGATFPANLKTDVGFEFQLPRRSVYVPVFRCSLPELFQVFDFANPRMAPAAITMQTGLRLGWLAVVSSRASPTVRRTSSDIKRLRIRCTCTIYTLPCCTCGDLITKN